MKSANHKFLSHAANYRWQTASLVLCLCVLLAALQASAATNQGVSETKPGPPQEQAQKQEPPKDAKKTPFPGPRMIFLPSPSALYTVEIMVMAGSVDDPPGKEGLANLVARALVEGGSHGSKTQDKPAETKGAASSEIRPTVRVDKQTTTFSMTMPREAFPAFVDKVLKPMFSQPSFGQGELDRLRVETLAAIQSRLRLEQQETLGLEALESYIFLGTPLSPLSVGTVRGLHAIRREDLWNFYKVFYTSRNLAVATDADPALAPLLASAFPTGTRAPQQMCGCDVYLPPGREVWIITQPNAKATGIHLGFPIDAKRNQPDYWPLFVANTYFGAHGEDFGRLTQEMGAARGYTSGAYSYIEYLADRPSLMLPPPGTPRSEQYFSIWIRPVANQYAHFVLKAVTAELYRFILEGLTPEQVEEAKTDARLLYFNYGENMNRRLGYRLDDTFYGTLRHGYLAEMWKNIEAVTPDQVNAAIRKNLQVAALRYVITTDQTFAPQLAADLANGSNVTAKTLAEYQISEPVPPEKESMLAQDRRWIEYPLNLKASDIHIIKAEHLFESADLPEMEQKTIKAGVE
jgi:zinc protease